MALVAFNSEIAPIAEQVSEPMLGHIRLAWWREALDEIYAGSAPRNHIVVQALAVAIGAHDLPRDLFDRMLEGRMMDLESKQGIQSWEDFLAYLDATVVPLHQLMALVSGSDTDVRDCARRYGMAGLLRAMPYHLQHGVIRQPLACLQEHGLSPEAVERGDETERLRAYVMAMVERVQLLPRAEGALVIRLMDKVAQSYMGLLIKRDYQLSALPARLPWLPLRLWVMSLRG